MAGDTDSIDGERDDAAGDTEPASGADPTALDAREERQIAVGPDDAALTVPAAADDAEAAAMAAAVGAHLADRARAAATEEPAPEAESADRWRLAARLGGRRLPREIERGEEWAAAARSRW